MSNVLVAYFSASGTTARAAQSLAKAAGADQRRHHDYNTDDALKRAPAKTQHSAQHQYHSQKQIYYNSHLHKLIPQSQKVYGIKSEIVSAVISQTEPSERIQANCAVSVWVNVAYSVKSLLYTVSRSA